MLSSLIRSVMPPAPPAPESEPFAMMTPGSPVPIGRSEAAVAAEHGPTPSQSRRGMLTGLGVLVAAALLFGLGMVLGMNSEPGGGSPPSAAASPASSPAESPGSGALSNVPVLP